MLGGTYALVVGTVGLEPLVTEESRVFWQPGRELSKGEPTKMIKINFFVLRKLVLFFSFVANTKDLISSQITNSKHYFI
ncbi:MAG: hypothetical protein K1X29_08450 [Bdellovibrionales bacterium]|nr:hypothetical protein [Bdellovibrionales bacterium]